MKDFSLAFGLLQKIISVTNKSIRVLLVLYIILIFLNVILYVLNVFILL